MIEKAVNIVPLAMNGERFDKVAPLLFADFSRKKIKAIIDKGGAYLNKKRVIIASKVVKSGDTVELYWEEKTLAGDWQKGAGIWTDILSKSIIEDNENFLVINKPAGIPSQSTLISVEDSIIHALSILDSKRFPLNSLHLVHRLDKDTSGILILARNKIWQEKFENVFRLSQAKKTYQAICFNIPKDKQGIITNALMPDRSRKNTWMPIFRDNKLPKEAKKAQTSYEVKETYPKCEASWITCFPATGRTHQIRVHLMAIGCPIIGDKTYANNLVGHCLGRVAVRHMLHAERIIIPMENGVEREWSAPLPQDFIDCIAQIKKLNSGI